MSSEASPQEHKFSKYQPKPGDVVLSCDHVKQRVLTPEGRLKDTIETYHFYHAQGGVSFQRPDQSFGSATWLVLCDPCFKTNAANPNEVITGDFVWHGTEPIIEENL